MNRNKLKEHWDDQYRLSANRAYAEFRAALVRGGSEALAFLGDNADLAETVFGGRQQAAEAAEAVRNGNDASENKAYYYREALRLLVRVREVLRRKYDASVRCCEALGIPAGDYTPETLLPGIRRAEERAGAAGSGSGAGIPNPAERPTDDLAARINLLAGDGASAFEIRQAVASDARAAGWSDSQVGAYTAEITARKPRNADLSETTDIPSAYNVPKPGIPGTPEAGSPGGPPAYNAPKSVTPARPARRGPKPRK